MACIENNRLEFGIGLGVFKCSLVAPLLVGLCFPARDWRQPHGSSNPGVYYVKAFIMLLANLRTLSMNVATYSWPGGISVTSRTLCTLYLAACYCHYNHSNTIL